MRLDQTQGNVKPTAKFLRNLSFCDRRMIDLFITDTLNGGNIVKDKHDDGDA